MYVKDSKLTVGELQVEVTDCSRLTLPDTATKLYCSLSLGTESVIISRYFYIII